jgi:hypothetical protein
MMGNNEESDGTNSNHQEDDNEDGHYIIDMEVRKCILTVSY